MGLVKKNGKFEIDIKTMDNLLEDKPLLFHYFISEDFFKATESMKKDYPKATHYGYSIVSNSVNCIIYSDGSILATVKIYQGESTLGTLYNRMNGMQGLVVAEYSNPSKIMLFDEGVLKKVVNVTLQLSNTENRLRYWDNQYTIVTSANSHYLSVYNSKGVLLLQDRNSWQEQSTMWRINKKYILCGSLSTSNSNLRLLILDGDSVKYSPTRALNTTTIYMHLFNLINKYNIKEW